MKTENTFKAVQFMRKRRDELSKLHTENPEEYKKQLKETRRKYKNKFKQPKKHLA